MSLLGLLLICKYFPRLHRRSGISRNGLQDFDIYIYIVKGSLAQKLPIYERHLSKVKSSRVESSRVESSRVESSRVESSRVESSRVESSRIVSSRVESSRVGQVE